MSTIVTKQDILENLKKEFNETEFAVFEGMLQGESGKDTSENFAIPIAEAAAHRRLIYEVLENFVDIANHKKEKQARIIAWFNSLPGQEGPIEEKCVENIIGDTELRPKQIESLERVAMAGGSQGEIQELLEEIIDLKAKNKNSNEIIRDLKACHKHNEKAYMQTLDQQQKNCEQLLDKKEQKIKELENKIFYLTQDNQIYKEGLQDKTENKKFYVFNPTHGQPRKVYTSYISALNDAKQLSSVHRTDVVVLQILTKCSSRTLVDVIDMTNSADELTEDEIPY